MGSSEARADSPQLFYMRAARFRVRPAIAVANCNQLSWELPEQDEGGDAGEWLANSLL
jgi:hypothetical protein